MAWNWQLEDWPHFRYNSEVLDDMECTFMEQSGVLLGVEKHMTDADKDLFVIESVSDEAIKTSEIEGEYLDRDSVQSSIKKHFGLGKSNKNLLPEEDGIGQMMKDLYKTCLHKLTEEDLFRWHTMLLKGRDDIIVGGYRTHEEPMQVISGRIDRPKVHFEAPPSRLVSQEMKSFVKWFNQTGPTAKKSSFRAIERAALAHLYFESIHPFEDGNGRIGRAISEKALSQSLGRPTLIALSHVIERSRKEYYKALSKNSITLEVTNWLTYFGKTILGAQKHTESLMTFLLEKTQMYERLKDTLNQRQEKVLKKLFDKGLEGFSGGLSAQNYIRIAKTSRATATRDLNDLVQKQALVKKGTLKCTRYYLAIKTVPA